MIGLNFLVNSVPDLPWVPEGFVMIAALPLNFHRKQQEKKPSGTQGIPDQIWKIFANTKTKRDTCWQQSHRGHAEVWIE